MSCVVGFTTWKPLPLRANRPSAERWLSASRTGERALGEVRFHQSLARGKGTGAHLGAQPLIDLLGQRGRALQIGEGGQGHGAESLVSSTVDSILFRSYRPATAGQGPIRSRMYRSVGGAA
jgi:hypothetical protein